MTKKIFRIVAVVIGFIAGFQFINGLTTLRAISNLSIPSQAIIGGSIFGGAVFGLFFYLLTPVIISNLIQFSNWLEGKISHIPTQDMVLAVIGAFIGLAIGVLVYIPISSIPIMGTYLALIITLIMGYLGMKIALNRKDDLDSFTSFFSKQEKKSAKKIAEALEQDKNSVPKILDTSVIIDGRISDICKTGFLEGPLVIPSFVLEELRHIADSSDLLKRNRGRRGLDILKKIQKELDVDVEIYEKDVDETEVDSKLVKLAKEMKGKVVTNDYNLNKVSELHGVPVLNINELANAVKPVVLPGEEMAVRVIKDGKEAGQGVAYLDDGTMIVVDGGKRHIGEKLEVMVTSVLQTAAGRMIFAKPKSQLDKSHA